MYDIFYEKRSFNVYNDINDSDIQETRCYSLTVFSCLKGSQIHCKNEQNECKQNFQGGESLIFSFELRNGVESDWSKIASSRMMTMKKSFGGSKWRVCDFAWDTLTNCLKKFFVQNNLMLLQMMDDTRNLQVTDSIVRFHVSGFRGVHKLMIILISLQVIQMLIGTF